MAKRVISVFLSILMCSSLCLPGAMAVSNGGNQGENGPWQTPASEDTLETALMFAENFSTDQSPRKSSFNSDWRFYLGDNAAASNVNAEMILQENAEQIM